MIQDIYDPLGEYDSVFRHKFNEVAEETFAQLTQEANIDVDKNQKTCSLLYKMQDDLSALKKRLAWWKVLCAFLWIVAISGILMIALQYDAHSIWILLLVGLASVVSLVMLFWKVMPIIKQKKKEQEDVTNTIDNLQQEAWDQLAPLNALYDWDIFTRMMSRTIPRLEFDPYFTTQRLADLEKTYGWDGSFNEERSVVYAHSGLINGNPFVICRTKKMEMGEKTYHGELEIHWTTIERDSDGKSYTRHHSETLHAEVTAPYPGYYETTRVIYGNTAGPDLIFSREQSDLIGREDSLAYKWERRKLRKKTQDLKNNDYAMMANEEFEVLFNTSNRNNNHQFALLFTPMAQENILKILQDKAVGYGDDFSFYKHKMINTITPQHMQDLNLDLNPDQYLHFDYEQAKENFISVNKEYFRAIYFCMAPLLCVPMYQQIRPQEAIYGRDMKKCSSFWEHESLANFWGIDQFKHPDCVTDCILKTEKTHSQGDAAVITVSAYGYRVEQRLAYVEKYGGDGNWHQVPVYWDEYLPVTGMGSLQIEEDNEMVDEQTMTPIDRLRRTAEILQNSNLSVYRRHIASKV